MPKVPKPGSVVTCIHQEVDKELCHHSNNWANDSGQNTAELEMMTESAHLLVVRLPNRPSKRRMCTALVVTEQSFAYLQIHLYAGLTPRCLSSCASYSGSRDHGNKGPWPQALQTHCTHALHAHFFAFSEQNSPKVER